MVLTGLLAGASVLLVAYIAAKLGWCEVWWNH